MMAPGSPQSERPKVVKRGQRLDETKPGSGLELSIVADLAHLYKGRFDLEPSPEGGFRAKPTCRQLDFGQFLPAATKFSQNCCLLRSGWDD